MSVQELIDELNTIEDKSMIVKAPHDTVFLSEVVEVNTRTCFVELCVNDKTK